MERPKTDIPVPTVLSLTTQKLKNFVNKLKVKRKKLECSYKEIPNGLIILKDISKLIATLESINVVIFLNKIYEYLLPYEDVILNKDLDYNLVEQLKTAGYTINDYLEEYISKLPKDDLMIIKRYIQFFYLMSKRTEDEC